MDAKPIRGFRVLGDENAIPTLPDKKILHSRNKSSPALSVMAAAGAMKLPAKRTAFGDVSNVVRTNQSSVDHAAPPVKQPPIQLQIEKRAAPALQQPAQRPKSLGAGLKEMISSVATKPLAESNKQLPANSLLGRALSKKNTTIFKDYSTLAKPTVDISTSQDVAVLNDDSGKPTGNADESHPVATATEGVPEKVRKTKSIQSIKEPKTSTTEQSANPARGVLDRSSAILAKNAVTEPERCALDVPEKAGINQQPVLARATHLSGSTKVEQASTAPSRKTSSSTAGNETRQRFLNGLEPEELLDDEYDEEEIYEDDGYVTARSTRSKADNLTGNFTTTIIPRTNIKVRKELDAAAAIVQTSRPLNEMEDEAWDVTMVSEYKDEIFDYFKELEIRMAPNPHYMDFQTEIQWSMRAVLMDWVVQVHHRFQLLPETLFLCANLIDRFLSCKVVSLGKLQLVGATAIFIASKYEEINCPSVGEIVYMVDNGYSIEEVLKAERFMLSLLQFDLGWPGPMSFLRRISTADDYDLETRTLAKYFLEITIMDHRFLGCPPSFTAAGAHCLARSMLKKGHWSTSHVHYSGYTYAQLLPVLDLMLDCLHDPTRHHGAIYEKYTDKRFKCASQFVSNEMARGYRAPSLATNEKQTYHDLYLEPTSLREYTTRGLLDYGMGGLIEWPSPALPDLLI